MSSDDVMAGCAILFGAVCSVLVTSSLVSELKEPTRPGVSAVADPLPHRGEVVDFAIIRDVELMVGPEGPHSGWHGRAEFPSNLRPPDRTRW